MSTSNSKSTDDLAFNIQLVAYDHNLPDRSGQELLVVQKLTHIPNIATFLQDKKVQVPGIEPSKQELDIVDDDDDAFVGVWVGMRPSQALDYRSKTSSSQPKGASVEVNDGFIYLEHDPNALRVIAPLRKRHANYYSLINQDQDGLCNAVHTPMKEVFFFPEFRDDIATSWSLRRSTWAAKVRQVCVYQSVDTSEDDEEDEDKEVGDEENNVAIKREQDVSNDDHNMQQDDESWTHRLTTSQTPLNLQECSEVLKELKVPQPASIL